MQPAISFSDLMDRMKYMFSRHGGGDQRPRVRMIGLIFARPNSPLARDEILPQINDWHYRSGEHIDFFFAGYTYSHPVVPGYQEVPIPGSEPWLYSAQLFDAFRKDIEARTAWKYSGGCELLLTNAHCSPSSATVSLDFSTTICCRLNDMKDDEAIRSVESFFESVFRFAETASGADPTWGFSDTQGVAIAGGAIKRVVLSLLPKSLDADYRKAEHLVVRNVGR